LISGALFRQTPLRNHLAAMANEMGDWTAIAAFGRDQEHHIARAGVLPAVHLGGNGRR